jgi:hypothetical protein
MKSNKKFAVAIPFLLLLSPLAKTASPSRQELHTAEVLSRIALAPDAQTDVTFPELRLELLATGAKRIASDVPLPEGTVKADIAVAVDTEALTYRLFHIRNDDDERRFAAFREHPSADIPKHESKLSFQPALPEKARFGCPDCWGDYGGHVRAVDIPQIELAKTWVTIWFSAQGSPWPCRWDAGGNGGCYATNWPTTWFNTWCSGSRPLPGSNPFESQSIQQGSYYNEDFFPSLCGRTTVFQHAAFYVFPSQVVFSWQYTESGSCSGLIFARVSWQGVSNCFL